MFWVVIASFALSFVLAFGLGANDVSNAFATSIGAKVLTLSTACLIASIAELAGSVSLGGLVTENIIKLTLIPGKLSHVQMMLGMMCSLLSVAFWLITATWLKLPVSATHAVISSIMGFGLIADPSCVNWRGASPMAVAWIIAPVLSGLASVLCFIIMYYFILRKERSFVAGIRAIPVIYMLTITINVGLICYQVVKNMGKPPTPPEVRLMYMALAGATTVIVAIGTLIAARFWIVPHIRRRLIERARQQSAPAGQPGLEDTPLHPTSDSAVPKASKEDPSDAAMEAQTEQLFAFLQILSAVFTSFAHGSNDVSNSIGPLFGLYNAYQLYLGHEPITSSSPVLYALLTYGAVGMIFGLYVWGARVIETIGENLTPMSPSRGFAIELGSALTVLVCSIVGLSVSTTHCKVGSIVAVGFFSHLISSHLATKTAPEASKTSTAATDDKVDAKPLMNWKLVINIVLSWVCTIPIAAGISAAFYALFASLLPEASHH